MNILLITIPPLVMFLFNRKSWPIQAPER